VGRILVLVAVLVQVLVLGVGKVLRRVARVGDNWPVATSCLTVTSMTSLCH